MSPLLLSLAGLAALLVATLAAGAIVGWRTAHPPTHGPDDVVELQRLGAPGLGARATILQFSGQSSARCLGAHRTLATVADATDGVVHLDVDLTDRPDIARHFDVQQLPTTLILDAEGIIQTRFGGPPRRDVVELEVARVAAVTAPVPLTVPLTAAH